MHGKVNMVPSRGTCTLLASYEVAGPRPGARGLQKRAHGLCVNEPTPGQMPHQPARRTRGSAALRRHHARQPRAAVIRPGQGRAPRPPRTRDPGFFFPSRQWGPEQGNARARHRPSPSLPQRRPCPGKPDRRTATAAAKETFSPEQPGSSALRQRSLRAPSLLFSKQAPRRSRDARLLGDWARVPHMEAPLLEPLGLECSVALTQPDSRLVRSLGSALPGPPSHFPCSRFLFRAHSNSIARVSRPSCL